MTRLLSQARRKDPSTEISTIEAAAYEPHQLDTLASPSLFGEPKLVLVPALEHSLESWDSRIPTGRLNAFLGEIVAAHPHPLRGGKQPRILFGTQVSSRPPKFVLFTTGFLDPGYRRFIMRRLRETFDFTGTPIEISMRVRERRSLGERQSAKAKKGKGGRR